MTEGALCAFAFYGLWIWADHWLGSGYTVHGRVQATQCMAGFRLHSAWLGSAPAEKACVEPGRATGCLLATEPWCAAQPGPQIATHAWQHSAFARIHAASMHTLGMDHSKRHAPPCLPAGCARSTFRCPPCGMPRCPCCSPAPSRSQTLQASRYLVQARVWLEDEQRGWPDKRRTMQGCVPSTMACIMPGTLACIMPSAMACNMPSTMASLGLSLRLHSPTGKTSGSDLEAQALAWPQAAPPQKGLQPGASGKRPWDNVGQGLGHSLRPAAALAPFACECAFGA